MKRTEMIQSLRAEITKLQQVLDLLLEGTARAEPVRRPGRPTGSSNKAASFNPEELAPTKRTMSAEGKARIAAAQKKRWAFQKATLTKRPSNTSSSKSAGSVAPTTAKKSAGAGKRTSLSRAKTQTAPAKRKAGVAKKGAAQKTVARKALRLDAKRAAAPTSEPQLIA